MCHKSKYTNNKVENEEPKLVEVEEEEKEDEPNKGWFSLSLIKVEID